MRFVCALLAAVGTLSISSEGTAQSIEPSLEEDVIMVVDNDGRTVGKVGHGIFGTALIPFTVTVFGATDIVTLGVVRNGFTVSDMEYQTVDCSGNGFVRLPAQGPMALGLVSGPNNTLYVGPPGAPFRTVTLLSKWNAVTGVCSRIFVGSVDRNELAPVVDLDDEFTPPFSVEGSTLFSVPSQRGPRLRLVGPSDTERP